MFKKIKNIVVYLVDSHKSSQIFDLLDKAIDCLDTFQECKVVSLSV